MVLDKLLQVERNFGNIGVSVGTKLVVITTLVGLRSRANFSGIRPQGSSLRAHAFGK